MSPMAHANARHSEVGALVDTDFGGSDVILRVEGSPYARIRSRSGHAGLLNQVLLTDVFGVGYLLPGTRPQGKPPPPTSSLGVWWQPAYRNKQRQCLATATPLEQSFPNKEPSKASFRIPLTPDAREIGQGPIFPVVEAWGRDDLSLSTTSDAAVCDPIVMIRAGERLRSDRGARRDVARARWPAEKRNDEA